MNTSNLYVITRAIQEVLAQYERGEDSQACIDTIEALKISLDDKLSGCCAWLKTLKARGDMFLAESHRLQDIANKYYAEGEAFKKYIAKCIGEGTDWYSGVHEISWRKSSAVKIIDEDLIPIQYLTEHLEYTPDKKQITQDIKAGATIPGCALEERQNIQIK